MFRWLLLTAIFYFVNYTYGQLSKSDSSINGVYRVYDGQKLLIKGHFKNQIRNKLWTWYASDGSVVKQIRYKHGKPLWILYFEKNKPWLKINRNGKRRIIRACECRESS